MKVSSRPKRIGPDAKARRPTEMPVVALRFQRRRAIAGWRARTSSRVSGAFTQIDLTPRGSPSALVIGTTGPQGGISVDPGVTWAYRVRRMLKPIRVAPVFVYDAHGQVIATVTTDPVTGQRIRTEVDHG